MLYPTQRWLDKQPFYSLDFLSKKLSRKLLHPSCSSGDGVSLMAITFVAVLFSIPSLWYFIIPSVFPTTEYSFHQHFFTFLMFEFGLLILAIVKELILKIKYKVIIKELNQRIAFARSFNAPPSTKRLKEHHTYIAETVADAQSFARLYHKNIHHLL